LTTQRIQWLWRPQADLRGVAPLLVMQLISGAWILPQGAFFPIYLEELLHLSPFAIAAIIAAAQAAGLAAALVGGGLTDVLGSKRVLVMGLAGGAVASLVFQTQLPLLVTGLWCLGGMAGSLQTLGASSYLTRAVAPERLGLLSALFALSFTIGGAASNPAAGWLLDASGFSLFGLAGVVVLAAAALLVQLALPAQSSGGSRDRRAGGDIAGIGTPPDRPVIDGAALSAYGLLRHGDGAGAVDAQRPGRQQDDGGDLRHGQPGGGIGGAVGGRARSGSLRASPAHARSDMVR
jgi:MFS family permease